ncbi:MAG: hypothetical protein ACK493_12980 [Planctomycetota bacterium]
MFRIGLLLASLLMAGPLSAQHCAPITESYLSAIQFARQKDGLTLSLEYTKTGGRRQPAYQAYLLAYPESLTAKIGELTPQQALERNLMTVLETHLLPKNETGRYAAQWELKTEAVVEKLKTAGMISEERVNDIGGWKHYKERIRFAIFIPFLEDERYSNLKDLPADRHECNYANEAALLFETLPQTLTVSFGIVQAVRLEKGVHYLEFNGNRPAGSTPKSKPERP